MTEESKSIDCRGRTTCMVFFILLLFVDPHLSRKMLEAAEGIEYIHLEGVVHGDLRGVFYLKYHIILRC
jgi:hypothetical protein